MYLVIFNYTNSYDLLGDLMIFLRNALKNLGYSLICLLILTAILTILNYLNIFGRTLTNAFLTVNLAVSILLGSILTGMKSTNKGWLEGLKFGLIFSVLLLLFNYLALDKFNIFVYLIAIISSVIGGMIGINFKKS